MENSKQSELIKSSLEEIRHLFSSDIILGDPIDLNNGSNAILVSKINLGVASGGVDYFSKHQSASTNFGGGGGTGISIEPIGFLIAHRHGTVELLDFNKAPKDLFARIFDLIEHSPEFFDKFKSFFNDQN